MTGSRRVRERLDAVEMPLKRTKKSQKALQRLFNDARMKLDPWTPVTAPSQI